MSDYYILQEKEPVPASLDDWAAWYDSNKCCVEAEIVSEHTISTRFLGIDHKIIDYGRPLLFETMIFGPNKELNGYQERCFTWEQAVLMHEQACLKVRETLKEQA